MRPSQALPLNNPPSWKHGTNQAEEAMKMYRSPSNSQGDGRQDDKGFTLIEILIAIVLIGILSAVAVVGISSLVSKGGSSACTATRDSAIAGSAVYFASNGNKYPVDFGQLTTAGTTSGAPMTMPAGVEGSTGVGATPTWHTPVALADVRVRSGSAWTLTMVPNANLAIAPSFSACP